MFLTNEDIKKIQEVIAVEVEPLRDDLNVVKVTVQAMTASIDGLLHVVDRHDQELVVLRAQGEKTRLVLAEKGVATREDLAVL